jgi:KDO2-lipid IV(A) lauroyltransferase
MARNKSPFIIYLEYIPVRGLFGLLRALPFAWGRQICKGLLNLLLFFLPKRRKIVAENLALCLPDLTLSQRKSIARQSADYLAQGLAAYPKIPDILSRNTSDWLRTEGYSHIDAALQAGKGAICFTAHYGFWELMAIHFSSLYKNVAMIVRPLDNPLLNGYMTAIRGAGGGSVIPHRKALKEGLLCLRKNGVLGILIDQNFYKGGLFVDFFGRLAATTSIVSLLARRTGAVVFPFHNEWDGQKIRVICEPPLALSQNPDPEKAMAEDTQRMTKVVEGWIRQDPAQWLWLHNRWKRRPEPGDYVHS